MAEDWKVKGQQLVYKIIEPLISLLVKWGVTPNAITMVGLFINVIAAIVLVYGAETIERDIHTDLGWAGMIILLGGLMDMVDGRLARVSKQESKYGAFFDSVIDRYSEMIMFLGICYYLIAHHYFLSSLFAFVALIGSVMVSYTRSRAEGLGLKMADVGLMQRPERILLIGISGVLCGLFSSNVSGDVRIIVDFLPFPLFETISIFTFPLFVLSILTNLTAISRMMHVKKTLAP